MSSWKKASKTNQKVHRERSQLSARQHLGLLEKKKDYKLRAKDRNDKEATLRLLRKRALNKNPDEFYHHMINSKITNGEHREDGKEHNFSKEQIQLMQTQDVKYVSMKRTVEANKIRRLQSQLHMTDVADDTPNQHTFFLEDEREAKTFNLAERLDTHPDLIGRRTNRPRLGDLGKMNLATVSSEEIADINQQRTLSYRELMRRIDREKDLTVVQKTIEIKRTLKQKRALKPKLVVKGSPNQAPIFKFKYERKR